VVAASASVKCVDKAVAAGPPTDNPPRPPNTGGGETPSTGSAAPPKQNVCETINVDDIVLQAKNQYAAGFAKTALTTMIKALSCKQDPLMFRQAALYACVAHDASFAKLYYGKLQGQEKSQILGRCLQEGIQLQAP